MDTPFRRQKQVSSTPTNWLLSREGHSTHWSYVQACSGQLNPAIHIGTVLFLVHREIVLSESSVHVQLTTESGREPTKSGIRTLYRVVSIKPANTRYKECTKCRSSEIGAGALRGRRHSIRIVQGQTWGCFPKTIVKI